MSPDTRSPRPGEEQSKVRVAAVDVGRFMDPTVALLEWRRINWDEFLGNNTDKLPKLISYKTGSEVFLYPDFYTFIAACKQAAMVLHIKDLLEKRDREIALLTGVTDEQFAERAQARGRSQTRLETLEIVTTMRDAEADFLRRHSSARIYKGLKDEEGKVRPNFRTSDIVDSLLFEHFNTTQEIKNNSTFALPEPVARYSPSDIPIIDRALVPKAAPTAST